MKTVMTDGQIWVLYSQVWLLDLSIYKKLYNILHKTLYKTVYVCWSFYHCEMLFWHKVWRGIFLLEGGAFMREYTVFKALYYFRILWIAYYANIWVYPILAVLETHQRAIFITVLLAFFISIYILGDAINRALWRKWTLVFYLLSYHFQKIKW